MGKKYSITVDGKTHIVEVEELGISSKIMNDVVSNNIPTHNTQKIEESDNESISISENTVVAPLQGKLQEVKVNVGQSVKAGDVLLIIEAMKMENEVVAPNDGKVLSIYLNAGLQFNAGDALLELGA